MDARLARSGIGFTLIELVVVIAVVALLVGLVVPATIAAKRKAQRMGCVHNLKVVSLSFRIWSGENNTNSVYPMSVSTSLHGTKEHIDSGQTYRHFLALSNELNVALVLACPADRARQPAADWSQLSNSNISYFVGLGADETQAQMPLYGDRNIIGGRRTADRVTEITTNDAVSWSKEMHRYQGNVAVSDGSVQQTSTARLRLLIAQSGLATNRLAMP